MIEFIEPDHAKRKVYFKFVLFFLFVVVLGVILYSSYYGGGLTHLTGNVIGAYSQPASNVTEDLYITTALTVPDFTFKGTIDRLSLTGTLGDIVFIGDQQFDLRTSRNVELVFTDFEGTITFEGDTISDLSGKASEASVDGIPVSSKNGNRLKVTVPNGLSYRLLTMQNVTLPRLSYVTSGMINVNNKKTVVNVDEEKVSLDDFVGDVQIVRHELRLTGTVDELRVEGERELVVR